MMRALWTASTGMIAQQFNVDVISNNLANVNTVSYKKNKAEFKDLLYQTMNRAHIMDNQGVPVNLQVGNGVSVIATVKDFTQGSVENTQNPLDFLIEGEGFFMVLAPDGNIMYTRDGSFKLSVTDQGNMLTTSDGYPVLDEMGMEIYLDVDVEDLYVSPFGELSYTDETNTIIPLGQRIGIVKFPNRHALESIGGNFYISNTASGDPIPDIDTDEPCMIKQGYLELSNVQVVEEMVKLIVAQRAYEISSKAIQTADDMLGMANNLVR
ncbi:MAG TPA: flagellar basal-body rod protein FlgG [Clostridiaceae bacterium]|jgi:flagellar basal-body rod protein FlgG|nr:flagellar basal-body rod protein FlgG [Clostridiaceae bacterium]